MADLTIRLQVTIRWLSKGTGQEPQQVTGIIALETVKNADRKASQKWLIKTVYSEFNSGASSSIMLYNNTSLKSSLTNASQVPGSSTSVSLTLPSALLSNQLPLRLSALSSSKWTI